MVALSELVELIAKKRDGGELTREEIEAFMLGFYQRKVTDYQMSAMLMAIYLQGMTHQETADMTGCFVKSGRTLDKDLATIPGPKVDKHSTGGVGDKVSLVLAPLCASMGIIVPMMSGRGLGHTGGTLDKLESIPGFSSNLTTEEFLKVLREVGVSVIGPTSDVAPLDKEVYALRDVTATVASLPLIISSIMSKKIAEGPDSMVIDVKTGRGAFITDFDTSVELAKGMIAAGENVGKPTICIFTSMEQPLGHAVGNLLEVREAIDCLRGEGPKDVNAVTIACCAQMLVLAGKAQDLAEGHRLAAEQLRSGKAMEPFCRMMGAQDKGNCGAERAVRDFDAWWAENFKPRHTIEVRHKAKTPGVVAGINSLEIGLSCITLGAGRQAVTDELEYCAGVLLSAKMGEEVATNGLLCTIYTDRDDHAHTVERIEAAFNVVPKGSPEAAAIVLPELISHRVTSKGGVEPWATCLAGSKANGAAVTRGNGSIPPEHSDGEAGAAKRRKLEEGLRA